MHLDEYAIIKRPLVTEKGTGLSQFNQYLFEVDRRATKVDIAQAIAKLFKVKVESVNTASMKAEHRRLGSRARTKTAAKKAIVTLAKGEQIDMFTNL